MKTTLFPIPQIASENDNVFGKRILFIFSFFCLVFARVLKKTDIRRSWFHLHGYPEKMRLQRRPKGLLNGPPKTKLLVCAAVICSALVKEIVWFSGEWTVSVISSDCSCKDGNIPFTMVPFKPLSDQ